VDTTIGDNNSDGVFDGDAHDATADDDFDYQELLCHDEPHVLSSIGTQSRLSNMDILEKSSKIFCMMNQLIVVKNLLSCASC
jgi:hypothetical protein